MFRSKALKEPKKAHRLYLWWLETRVSGYYYDFVHKFIENPIFQVKRLIQWYLNVFRYDYDFDGHSLFAIIEYKLKRLQNCLINGHAIHDDMDLKALRLAIKLAGRLKEDKYEEIGHDRIERKWGKSTFLFEPIKGSTSSTMKSSRPGTPTKELEDQCWEETREQYRLADLRMKREERIFYAILHKYLRNLWD
jgi:hypothetical protein